MKTPQQAALEKYPHVDDLDENPVHSKVFVRDSERVAFLAGYSVAMEQQIDILNEVLEYDYQHLLKHRVSAISADLSDKIRKHLSSFTEREQPKDTE